MARRIWEFGWRRLSALCAAVAAIGRYDVGHGRGCRCEACEARRWDDRRW